MLLHLDLRPLSVRRDWIVRKTPVKGPGGQGGKPVVRASRVSKAVAMEDLRVIPMSVDRPSPDGTHSPCCWSVPIALSVAQSQALWVAIVKKVSGAVTAESFRASITAEYA